jgi:hypothetical protein
MELLVLLRLLWARRLLVGVGALLSLGAGFLMLQAPASDAPATTFVATGRVLVDTPESQLVNVNPRSSETLAMRAILFADLLAAADIRADLARHAGIAEAELDVLGPSTRAEPPVSSFLVTKAAPLRETSTRPYVLRVYANGLTPMIAVEGSATDPATATALVEAAVRELRAQAAPGGQRPDHGFEIELVGTGEPEAIQAGSRRRVFAAAAVPAVFGAWCVAIVMAAGLSRRGRSRVQPA